MFATSLFAPNAHYLDFLADLLDAPHLKRQPSARALAAEYTPLTRLSRAALSAAAALLEARLRPAVERRLDLEKLNKKENLAEYMALLERINELSAEFYGLVPQMGCSYERLAPISTERELNEQVCAVSRLSGAQMAVSVLMGARHRMGLGKCFYDID